MLNFFSERERETDRQTDTERETERFLGSVRTKRPNLIFVMRMKVAVGQKLNLVSMLELATCTSSNAAP